MNAVLGFLQWALAFLPARLLRLLLELRRARRRAVVQFRLSGTFREDSSSGRGPVPGGRSSVDHLQLLSDLDAAGKDPAIEAVSLRIGHLEASWAQIHELRAALHQLRSKGRHTFAYLERPGHLEYSLACACDHISLPPVTELGLVGLRAEVTFFKDALDKAGIQAHVQSAGEYKSAGEPFVRSSMSEEFRASLDHVLSELHAGLCRAIEGGRSQVEEGAGQAVLDGGPYTAAEARDRGLVDEVIYPDRWRTVMRRVLGEPEPERTEPVVPVTPHYGEPAAAEDAEATRPFPSSRGRPALRFAPASGFLRPWRWLRWLERRGLSTPRVAIVVLSGAIVGSDEREAPPGRIAWRPTVSLLRALRHDDRCEAVVLRVDSPGGDACASDLIWRELRRLAAKKPVVASMGGFAASGGYYLSMGADWIVAGPQTVTGSIGVVAGKLELSGLLEKLGLKREVLSYGAHTGLHSSSVGLTDGERARFEALVQDIYRGFVSRAADCRGLDYDALDAEAQGRIWTGQQAQERGLVDATGTLDDALAEAARRAHLGLQWEPWYYEQARAGLVARLLRYKQVGSAAANPAQWLAQLEAEEGRDLRALCRMPCDLQIR